MKWALIAFCTLASLGIGVALGYRTALDNQAYYDAPAKIVLYSSILEQGKTEEYFTGQIIRQIRILNEPETTEYKSEFMLLLPPHGWEFKEAYEQYLNTAKDKAAYKEALAFMCKHNKEYAWACE